LAQALLSACHDVEVRLTRAFDSLAPVKLVRASALSGAGESGTVSSGSVGVLWHTARGIAIRMAIARIRQQLGMAV
jgi:hypothetical protein